MTVKERIDLDGIDFINEEEICHIQRVTTGKDLCGAEFNCDPHSTVRYSGQDRCPDCQRQVCPECKQIAEHLDRLAEA